MPDTPANQQDYPQANTQEPGLGFPILRLVVLFALAVGTVLDAALGRYQGKHTGETALFHTLQHHLEPRDLLLADRYYSSWWELALVQQRGADLITRLHQGRHADFRRGRRLGPHDHVVTWTKPARPDWLDAAAYAALPATLALREVRVVVCHPGFRTKILVVVTTVVAAQDLSGRDIALLYRLRWYAEVNHPDYRSSDKVGWSRGSPCPGCVCLTTTRPVASWLSPQHARKPDMPASQRRPAAPKN